MSESLLTIQLDNLMVPPRLSEILGNKLKHIRILLT